LSIELASSGIKELDKLMGGGVPRGTQILLEVETGTSPLLFVEKWLHEGLRQQDVCFFYTKGGEYVRDFSKHIITIGEPNNANRIMDVMHGIWVWYREQYQGKESKKALVRSATYSLSTIVMTFGFERTYKLAKEISQVSKTENAMTLDVIGIGMHNSMELKTFEFLYDAVVRLETQEINGELARYIRVFKSPILDYVTKKTPYSFEKNDLVF